MCAKAEFVVPTDPSVPISCTSGRYRKYFCPGTSGTPGLAKDARQFLHENASHRSRSIRIVLATGIDFSIIATRHFDGSVHFHRKEADQFVDDIHPWFWGRERQPGKLTLIAHSASTTAIIKWITPDSTKA